MKRKSLFVLPVVVGALLFGGCEKEPAAGFDPDKMDYKMVTEKIKSFNQNLKLKNGSLETVSLTEAIWTVEAALNYNYGLVTFLANVYDYDSTLITIVPAGNNLVSAMEETNMYNQALQFMRQHFYSIEADNKQLSMVDVELKYATATEIVLKISTVVGIQMPATKSGNGTLTWAPFGATDYWFYGYNQGKCNGYTGEGDAAQKFNSYIAAKIAQEVALEGPVHYTSIVSVAITAYAEIYNPDNSSPFDYMIFRSNNPCLTPAAMNHYVNSTKEVMSNPSYGYIPTGKSPINPNLLGSMFGGTDKSLYFHYGSFRYGKKWIGIPEVPREVLGL